jgi:hypothetical protein
MSLQAGNQTSRSLNPTKVPEVPHRNLHNNRANFVLEGTKGPWVVSTKV